MFSANHYDMILMDCRMPVMDGFEATQTIRALEHGHLIPIIALTANVQINDQHQCRESGMDDFLGKPFTRNELITLMSHWLDQQPEHDHVATPAAASPTDEHFESVNPAVLQTLKINMGEDFENLIRAFIHDTDNKMKKLQQFVRENSLESIILATHSLKSSSATLGALQMSDTCAQLEFCAAHDNSGEIPELLEKLQHNYLQVKQYFDTHLK
jgi:CheY-like chemotaxis protein